MEKDNSAFFSTEFVNVLINQNGLMNQNGLSYLKPLIFALSCSCYGVTDLPLSFSSQLCNFSCHPLRLEEASVFHLLNKSPLFLFHFPFPLLKTHLGAKTSCSWLSLMPTLDRREGVKEEKDDLQTYSP